MTPDRRPDEVELEGLEQQLADVDNGDLTALTQAVAIYETRLASAHEADESDRYRGISRAYRERLITTLDDATQSEGWEFLADFLGAYHPETADEFPHVTTILQNVTGRYLIRTRLSNGVEAIPVEALEYFSSILDRLDGEGYDYILEGMHPYGWGIGHPDHSVADDIHQHASTDIFVVNAMRQRPHPTSLSLTTSLVEGVARTLRVLAANQKSVTSGDGACP